jgi:hypothetical protein
VRRRIPCVRWLVLVVSLCLVSTAAAGAPRTIAANGVKVVVPAGWHRVKPAPSAITDPVTVLVVGTQGVRSRLVPCEITAYRIPAAGAAVVVVRWRTETSGGGRPPRSRRPLFHVVLNPLGFECWPNHRGGAVELSLGGHAYQVNVLVGDLASPATVRQALAVVRSFDLGRR